MELVQSDTNGNENTLEVAVQWNLYNQTQMVMKTHWKWQYSGSTVELVQSDTNGNENTLEVAVQWNLYNQTQMVMKTHWKWQYSGTCTIRHKW